MPNVQNSRKKYCADRGYYIIMKIICKNCKKEIEAGSSFCTYCGTKNSSCDTECAVSTASRPRINRTLRVIFIITGAILAFVTLIFVLNANLLFPWQRGARKNKQVILEYAAEHYPDAQVIEEHYYSAKILIWNTLGDAIVFKLNDVEFNISAEAGKILIDGFPKARACAQFNKIIQDNFLEPRGISAMTDYIFVDNYYEIYPYTGSLDVGIKSVDHGSTPREVGWFYDFYKYWKKEGAFLTSYSVHLYIITDHKSMYHLDYDSNSEFPNESAFYSAFVPG